MKSLSTHRALQYILSSVAMLTCLLAFSQQLSAQSWVAQAQQNGFTLKKVESDTAIATGQTFSYTIYFSIPAGATNVTVTDVLPNVLEFLGASYTSPCGTPIVVSPPVNSMGGTYSLSWGSVPSGCSGSFTITVRFPNGTTCNGTTARNRVCVTGTLGQTPVDLCTPFISVRATAVEPWNVNKYIVGAAYQGGPCPYATGDSVVSYQICVYKDVGTTGQLNLVNGVVTDVLPPGATLQSSTCGATQSGNTITWNVGSLSATSMYNTVCCTISVLYPKALFPAGTQIQNQVVLTGTTGSPNTSCGNISDSSNKTCVEIKNISSATMSKWVYTNGQPGCAGKYLVYICNNGTTPIASFTVTDTVPAPLTSLSVGTVSAGLNVAITGGNIFTATSTSALAPGQCRYFEINFTIPLTAGVGSTINNCAWFTAVGMAPIKSCVAFTVSAPAPTACLWKEVCSKQPSYTPGSVFRYRLRIQNIGGQALSGTTLTDVLNPNLTYVGNPSYYTGTSWAAPCQTTSNWPGVTLSYNSGTNTVTASIPSIPAVCQNIFYSACGMYGTGGVPYYFIEFDVKVVDTTALGNIPNLFTLSGGSLTGTVTSNTDYVTVVGTAGFTLQKGVKKTGGGSYSTTATTSAGGSVSYGLRLTVAPGSVALRHTTFADLLPRDNGLNDQLILGPCTTRGSLFDVGWTSAITSTPPATPYNNATSFSAVNNLAPVGAPGAMFIGSCGTAGSWTGGISSGAKNLGYYFGSAPIASGFSASTEFNATVSNAAKDKDTACNSFAANAAVRHLISSSIISDQKIGELESNRACILIQKEGCLDSLKVDVVCAGLDANGDQQYSFTITGWNANTAGVLMLSSPDGTFSPTSFPVAPGTFSLSTTFTDVPPVNGMVTIYLTLVVNGQIICRDSVLRDLPPCDIEVPQDCCKDFINKVDITKLNYNNAGQVNLTATISAGPAPIKKFVATIVSVQRRLVCGNVAQPWQRAFGDITAGALSSTLSPGPMLLQIFSREAQWGPGECVPFMNGVGLNLKMLFPPVPSSPFCKDTLIFAIRYSFTDCKCVTCDIIKYDTLVRRRVFYPWDFDDVGIGLIRNSVAKTGDEVQSDTAAVTSLEMISSTEGTLWIVNPAEQGNDVTVVGAEVSSSPVSLTGLESGASSGVIVGNTGFISLDGPPGSTLGVDLTFANPNSVMQFPVDVRYLFTVGTDPEQQYSDVQRYTARVPDAAADRIDPDLTIKPDNVRTYAMYFTNANGYNEPVYSFRIQSNGSAQILAVGPANTDSSSALLIPISQPDGSTMVSAFENGITGIAPGSAVKPIYITLSNVDGAASFDYSSFDVDGQLISDGTFELTNPISGVQEGGGGNASARMSVKPNPVSSSATLSVSVDEYQLNAGITLVDASGRVIKSIFSGNLDIATHIITFDTNNIASGAYFIVMQTSSGVVSQPLIIAR